MEHNHSIPKTKHIHKTIPSLLFTVALLLCTALINPLTVHAGSSTEVEAEYSDGSYKATGDKWYSTYCPTAGYKGQGVLLYLLERNGGGPVSGTSPKAYACGATMETYELHAQDKYNRYPEVTHWEGTEPYWSGVVPNNGGFMKNSTYSNTAAIKSWLKTPVDGHTNGIAMVSNIWGSDIATRFTNEELILIAEPIVAVQFSQYYTSPLLDITSDMDSMKMLSNLKIFKSSIGIMEHTVMSKDLEDLLDKDIVYLEGIKKGQYTGAIADSIKQSVISDLQQLISGTNCYYPLGETYAGTSKMVASYYASLSPDQSIKGGKNNWKKADAGRTYYRTSSSAAAFIPQGSIICANANFTLWDKGTSAVRQMHSVSNLQTYSIGMLAMLAFTDEGGQTTCDEPLIPQPHPAPNESTGTTTIIKSYRTRNTTTNTLTDDGTFTSSNLSNQIFIENETNYQVIAWKTSSTLNSSINSLTWESSVPAVIGNQGTTSTSVTLPSSQKYLYVLLEKPDIITPATTNYTLTQSSITRHIYLSHPDAQLTMPQIQSHTFTWSIPAHSEGSCSGHSYTCSSPDCSNKSYGSCDCNKCDDNCTTDHNGKEPGMGHQTNHDSDCDSYDWSCGGHTAYCTWGQWTNTDLTLKLTNPNSSSYPDILATKSGWQTPSPLGSAVEWFSNYTRGTQTAFHISASTIDYNCIIHRGKDKLTVASWKNPSSATDALTSVSSSGYSVANTSQGTRQTSDYTDKFEISITNGSSDLTTSRGITAGSGHGNCSDYSVSGSFDTSTNCIIFHINFY